MKVGNFAKLLRRMVLSDTSSAGYLFKVEQSSILLEIGKVLAQVTQSLW